MLRGMCHPRSLLKKMALPKLYSSREAASVGKNLKVKKLLGLLGSGNDVVGRRGVRVGYGL
jgi:hypothetical protein